MAGQMVDGTAGGATEFYYFTALFFSFTVL